MGSDDGLSPRSAGRVFRSGNALVSRLGIRHRDPLEQVLAPDYFALARSLLRPCELIYVSTVPPEPGRGEAARGEAHLALVMVQAKDRGPDRASGSARPVQDFGAGRRADADQARPGPPARQPKQETGVIPAARADRGELQGAGPPPEFPAISRSRH